MTCARRRSDSGAGFTLLELLVVTGILAVLMGVGFGYLRRGNNGRNAALSAVAGALRQAAGAAQMRGLPTEVRIDRPADDGGPWLLRARELLPIATFHMEPADSTLAPVLRPALGGQDVVAGRFGHCRQNLAGEHGPLLRLPVLPADFDLADGFVFRVDLRLHTRQACSVLRLQRHLELDLDSTGRPKARMVQRDSLGKSGVTATLQGDVPVVLDRWFTLEIANDGRELWLAVDGEVQARTDAGQALLQQDGDVLEVSPGDAAVPGLVDEVQWFSYVWSAPQMLPLDVTLAKPWRVGFGGHGEIDAVGPLVLHLSKDERDESFQVQRGGVIE